LGGRKKGISPEAMKKAETAIILYKQNKSAISRINQRTKSLVLLALAGQLYIAI
jgi:hypothetical protein